MQDTMGADQQFAEWYVWAKREVSSDARVCLGAALAAVEAEAGGADRDAARMAARRSATAHGFIHVDSIAPRRRAYAEWYDWARRELGGDPGRLHAATAAAIECIEHGGSAQEAAAAARVAAGLAGPVPSPEAPAPPPPPPTAPGWQMPVPGSAPAPTAAPAQWEAVEAAPRAGFGARLVAFLVDGVVLLIGSFLVLVLITIFFVAGLNREADATALTALTLTIFVFAVVLTWLYFAGLEYSAWQATVGKRTARLVVTDVAGRRIGFGRATARHFSKSAPLLLVLAGLLSDFLGVIVLTVLLALVIEAADVLLALVTRRRQALHDLIAGTVVVPRERTA